MRKRSGYFGLSETSEFLQWTWEQLQENILGNLIVSIGKGNLKDELDMSLRMACAWAIYNDKGV